MPFDYALARFIPYRDTSQCARVRAITKADITRPQRWAHRDFRIRVIEDMGEFYAAFATDIVTRIQQARDRRKKFIGIFPVGPMPQYAIAAEMINKLRLPLHHVHSFNMDEYADQDGNTAPLNWPGSFQRAMWESFFSKIDPKQRPPTRQIHFPTKKVIREYGRRIADLGGADVCYGGIGWCGHIAFWEAHLGYEFGSDPYDPRALAAYKKASARLVELNPMTIMQNALHSFGGDWSWTPPKANSIGPAEILGAKHRSFWLDGAFPGGVSWQRFIARLVAHGRVNTLVPGSILQTAPTDYNIFGPVADNVEIHMA